MTEESGAAIMLSEIERLADDLPILVEDAATKLLSPEIEALLRPVDAIELTGCGDSLQAAYAVEAMLAQSSGRPTRVIGPRRLIAAIGDSEAQSARTVMTNRLVVGISASGATPAVCEALATARAAGAITLAIVSQPDSPVEQIADRALVLPLQNRQRSPGIRTYQVSLIGLFVLAIRLGASIGGMTPRDVDRWFGRLIDTTAPLRETVEASANLASRIAEATAECPVSLFLAAGPHLATARYAAAKRIEASGLYAAGQDLEEAGHIERFVMPRDLPVAIVAPPGSTYREAIQAAELARRSGRRLFSLSASDAIEIRDHAAVSIDLAPAAAEALYPLICHPVFTRVAALEAQLLGRRPFNAPPANIRTE